MAFDEPISFERWISFVFRFVGPQQVYSYDNNQFMPKIFGRKYF